MKRILFGVQATGNGHISRASLLVPKLRQLGFEVDVLLSGREREKLFGLEQFGHYRTRRGFSFVLDDGRVNALRTFWQADIKRFCRDVKDLDVDSYDLILSDFEPVTAWAAKIRNRQCIGIGHQYAFKYSVPKQPFCWASRYIMNIFAPSDLTVGLHWDAFGAPILPPIVNSELKPLVARSRHYLVYLPFDEQARVISFLHQFSSYQFIYFAQVDAIKRLGNVTLMPYSRTQFTNELLSVEGVVCGAGFELPSEVLSLGKKLLVQPLCGQFEQESNARALSLLGYAHVMNCFDDKVMRRFLRSQAAIRVEFPDVAAAIAGWIATGCGEPVEALADRLWRHTKSEASQSLQNFRKAWALT